MGKRIDEIKRCRKESTINFMLAVVTVGISIIYGIYGLYPHSLMFLIFAVMFFINKRYWNIIEFILRREKK